MMCVKAQLIRLKQVFNICVVIGYIESNIVQMEKKTLSKSQPDSHKTLLLVHPISEV